MKKEIHPQYFLAKIKCVCGAEYEIPSTKPEITVEVCKNCSPLFTGKEEIKPIMKRVDRFLKRQQKKKNI